MLVSRHAGFFLNSNASELSAIAAGKVNNGRRMDLLLGTKRIYLRDLKLLESLFMDLG